MNNLNFIHTIAQTQNMDGKLNIKQH